MAALSGNIGAALRAPAHDLSPACHAFQRVDRFKFACNELLEPPQIEIPNSPSLEMLHRQIEIFRTRPSGAASPRQDARDSLQWQLGSDVASLRIRPEDQCPHRTLIGLYPHPSNSGRVFKSSDFPAKHAPDLAKAIAVIQSEGDGLAVPASL